MKVEFQYISDGSFFKLDGNTFKKDGVSGILEDGKRLVIKPNTIVEDLDDFSQSQNDCI